MASPLLPSDYKVLSGKFSYQVPGNGTMTFVWDGAAMAPDGSLVLIEEELTAPVNMHIQGHVARAAYMVAAGVRVRKLVWVVQPRHYSALWGIVEPWRMALRTTMAALPPPCEYWDQDGNCLGVSRDYR